MGFKRIGIARLKRKNRRHVILQNIIRCIGGNDVARHSISRCPVKKQWLWKLYNKTSQKIWRNEYTICQLKREIRLAYR